ncbi:tripartite tricarboxylate transporter permease [Dethiosulfatarculus sandiegensis]|uniref:C4-dicarboxylate ABC transporter permease n=1 Tax=Dethiosulfatarculus sandiegensis TaxID=1429043 RepID=A0A0D2JNR8_9BACT|nr:tripartite tricarboxylate transporter permease [Dethiosulfatarculus sandiegensis]KIX11135.1 C4-dicarboxylate ABC transporter permease [Dethiosulfatarculus sandiegensis]
METLSQAFNLFFQLPVIGSTFFGVLMGVILGSIPGLTATMAIALIVPMTFTMSPIASIGMLVGAYKGGCFGGSIPAIILNTPGTPAAAATVLDGHEMAKKGQSIKALKVAIFSSVLADGFSDIVLIMVAPPLALIALKMGPPEMTGLIIFSLLIITAVAGKSLTKGLIAGVIGLLVGTVGLDPIMASRRFGFDLSQLDEGISLMPMLIGLFALSEFFMNAQSGITQKNQTIFKNSDRPEDQNVSKKEFKSCLKIVGMASGIGTVLGAIPGIGPSIAAFASYAQAKKMSKTPEKFGKGAVEGVAAAEAGNNSVAGANLIPLLTLGIPGDVGAALLLGAFMIQGLHPGPLLFKENLDIIYGIFMALLLANVFNYFIARFYIRIASKVALVPKHFIFPGILAFCLVGAYGFNQSIFDVWMTLVFGVLGYILRKNGFPVAPLLIAFILEPILESSLRQSLLMSHGSPMIFFTHPISATFLALSVVGVVLTVKGKLNQH